MEKKIGLRIKHIREKKHETQESLSRRMGLSIYELDKIEKGLKEPSFSFMRTFCDDYRIPIDFLFGRYHFHSDDSLKKPHDLRSILFEFLHHYNYVKQFSMNDSYFTTFAANDVPSILSNVHIGVHSATFCHIGKDTWLDSPQIHFMFSPFYRTENPKWLDSIKDSYLHDVPYHCMYVFPKDMNGVYLAIVLNPYQYAHHFSSHKILSILNEKKQSIQKQFLHLYDDYFLKNISLHSSSLSSQLIEHSLVGAVFYDINSLPPNEELLEDLSLFSESYHHFLSSDTELLISAN